MRAEGNTRSPLRVIVSGGIGSGKSTVVEMMRQLGAVVIESDLIGHAILEPAGPAFGAVADRWPMVVIDGRIDRAMLAAIVFTDPVQLAALEEMTHPHIRAEIGRRVAELADRDIVVELPLATDLLGAGWTRVVIDAPETIRLRRTIDRGMDRQDAANRIATQPDHIQWRDSATHVVDNRGTIGELDAEVRALWAHLEKLAAS